MRTPLLLALALALIALPGCDATDVSGGSGPDTATAPTGAPASVVTTAGIVPRLISGNVAGDGNVVCKTGTVVGPGTGWWGFKVDPPVLGTATYGQFTVTVDEDGRSLSWAVDGTNQLRHVVVKGGRDTYVYDYDGSTASDSGLQAPANGGGNVPQISHYTICYDERYH